MATKDATRRAWRYSHYNYMGYTLNSRIKLKKSQLTSIRRWVGFLKGYTNTKREDMQQKRQNFYSPIQHAKTAIFRIHTIKNMINAHFLHQKMHIWHLFT